MAMNHSCIHNSATTSNSDEQKHRATMHINRKPVNRLKLIGQVILQQSLIRIPAKSSRHIYLFGVMTYSQYAYVEAFLDMKQEIMD